MSNVSATGVCLEGHRSRSRDITGTDSPMRSQVQDIRPNQTLYVQNLHEKVKRQELRQNLYYAFSQFGNIVEVHASKRDPRRGQAWIVFADLGGATKAMRGMQGIEFFGKKLRVSYAKAKSDTIAKMEGTYKPREKRGLEVRDGEDSKLVARKRSKVDAAGSNESGEGVKAVANSGMQSMDSAAMATDASVPDAEEESPPNKILFVRNLPAGASSAMLSELFGTYSGFAEARTIQGKSGIAFVEFADDAAAGVAKEALQGFCMARNKPMRIEFAKR